MKSSAKIRLAVAIESDRKKFIFDVYSRHISHSAFVIASIFHFKGNFFIDKYHSKKLLPFAIYTSIYEPSSFLVHFFEYRRKRK